MRSVRLDSELEAKLARAAAVTGESASEFIRRSVDERADATLAPNGAAEFADVLGVVRGGGGRARRTGEAFADLLSGVRPG